MSLSDSEQAASMLVLVAQPEAVAAAAFALPTGEADLTTGTSRVLRARVGGEGVTKIDCSLLEYLRGNLVPPGKSSHAW